jgi:type IV secretory pathway VirB2 component (pilin)
MKKRKRNRSKSNQFNEPASIDNHKTILLKQAATTGSPNLGKTLAILGIIFFTIKIIMGTETNNRKMLVL